MPAARGLLLVAAAAASFATVAQAYGEPQKYLIVSAPSTHRIAYVKLPETGAPASGLQMHTLVETGLRVPQGVAVDPYRQMLYVADPDLPNLVGYKLKVNGDALTVGEQEVVAAGVEARWVAVDGLGNVFFSDEPSNRIMRVTAGAREQGATVPEAAYEGSSVAQVSAPGGVAIDNFFVYWLNKASGSTVGSLIRASESLSSNATTTLLSLSSSAMKSYGVCLAFRNIFFTDEVTNLYAVKRTGGATQAVSTAFKEPRGCAFDGDGTLYVADKGQNAVYQLAANMDVLQPNQPLTMAAELQGAYGVAVYAQITS